VQLDQALKFSNRRWKSSVPQCNSPYCPSPNYRWLVVHRHIAHSSWFLHTSFLGFPASRHKNHENEAVHYLLKRFSQQRVSYSISFHLPPMLRKQPNYDQGRRLHSGRWSLINCEIAKLPVCFFESRRILSNKIGTSARATVSRINT